MWLSAFVIKIITRQNAAPKLIVGNKLQDANLFYFVMYKKVEIL